MKNEMTFEDIKKAYERKRDEERVNICNYLKENGFDVVTRGNAGKGRTDYSARGKLNKPYDLSNWKYVEAYKENVLYFISLQAFDYDPASQNKHVLMDRIGLYKYSGTGLKERYKFYDAFDAFSKMVITDLELPLSEVDLSNLLQVMEDIPLVQ